jgi:hypothetical protein
MPSTSPEDGDDETRDGANPGHKVSRRAGPRCCAWHLGPSHPELDVQADRVAPTTDMQEAAE